MSVNILKICIAVVMMKIISHLRFFSGMGIRLISTMFHFIIFDRNVRGKGMDCAPLKTKTGAGFIVKIQWFAIK